MALIIFKIWMVLLTAADLMIVIQILARIVLFLAGRTRSVDWTRYNKIMLTLLAAAFLPVTAVVLYLRS